MAMRMAAAYLNRTRQLTRTVTQQPMMMRSGEDDDTDAMLARQLAAQFEEEEQRHGGTPSMPTGMPQPQAKVVVVVVATSRRAYTFACASTSTEAGKAHTVYRISVERGGPLSANSSRLIDLIGRIDLPKRFSSFLDLYSLVWRRRLARRRATLSSIHGRGSLRSRSGIRGRPHGPSRLSTAGFSCFSGFWTS